MKTASIKKMTGVMVSLALAVCCVVSSPAAEMLPGEVSDLIRDLGEWRKVTEGMMEEARRAVATNETRLTAMTIQYIEASAAANSLIEQLQLELAARTQLDARRYTATVDRTKDKCRALTNECYRLMASLPKTRGTTSSASDDPSSKATAAMNYATKSVAIADGLFGALLKNRKAFRDLDTQQRVEVRKLLEERKWKLLEIAKGRQPTTATSSDGTGDVRSQTNKPPASASGGH